MFWNLVVARIVSLKVTIMAKNYFRCRSDITCARLIRLKRCSSAFSSFIQDPPQSRFDIATDGTPAFYRVLMDRERFWCVDRTVNLEQRDITSRPGQPTGPTFAGGRLDRPALDSLARVRRTKLELVFTLPAIKAELTSAPDAYPKLAIICVAIENWVLSAIL